MKNYVSFGAGILVILVFAVILKVRVPVQVHSSGIGAAQDMVPIGPLVSGSTFEEYVHVGQSAVNYVDLMMATYGRANTCTITTTVERRVHSARSTFWRVISTQSSNGRSFSDNSYHLFSFPEQHGMRGQWIRIIVVSPDGTAGNSLTLWRVPTQNPSSAYMEISGERYSGYVPFNVGLSSRLPVWRAISRTSTQVPIKRFAYVIWVVMIGFIVSLAVMTSRLVFLVLARE